ncbi:hypothetical protein HPO96_28200 [Kribbella sandramycini]|uniref:Uncharacterized protein n=1 Tax=Kribbella sandramycini TaxID=60450 RepID=A0A7Y4P3I2_9ACTN|nr:hypothetical protein [Kribbella sandramycini]MBB6571485.1 hypothetical protein [Kribbella sandramycini]NOL44135.1 hypothetical protein [Kribbella sandramycini]
MTATTYLVTAEIDPNVVKPGWVALLIVLGLGVATFLLWRNMGKQLKKIDFDDAEGGRAASSGPATSASSAAPDAAEATPTAPGAPTQSDSKEHSAH